jgi:hypothetical protein
VWLGRSMLCCVQSLLLAMVGWCLPDASLGGVPEGCVAVRPELMLPSGSAVIHRCVGTAEFCLSIRQCLRMCSGRITLHLALPLLLGCGVSGAICGVVPGELCGA